MGNNHGNDLCKKACQKPNVLARLAYTPHERLKYKEIENEKFHRI